MQQSTFKVAVIGCGRIAGHHCKAITAIDGFQLVAISDIDSRKSQQYATEFSVPHYVNYHEMFTQHPEINLVVIATPSGMHYEHAMEVMERYSKNIVVEKPPFMRLEQMRSAFEYAAANGLKIFPIFQNRYNRAVARVKSAIENGELGEINITSVRVRWCRGQQYYDLAPWRGTYSHDGGALTNQGIHHLDLLRYLCGEVSAVQLMMRTLGVDVEVEDTAVGIYRHENGAVGNLEITTSARPDNFEASISILGTKGLAQLGGIAVNELQIFTPDPEECSKHSENFANSVYGNGHYFLYQSIYDALCNASPYLIQHADAEKTLALLHACYVSAETEQWISPNDEYESKKLGMANEAIANYYRVPQNITI